MTPTEGWRDLRLKSLVFIAGGGTPAADAENWDGDIPFVTPPDLRPVHGGLCMQTARYLTAAGARAGSTVVDGGAVLVSKRAPIGYVSQVAMRVAFNQGCLALVPYASVDPSFLTWALSVRSDEMNVLGRGTTFMEISAGDLGKIRVCTPPVYEQRQIAAFLDRETAKIDALIGKQEQLIDTLRERRLAIIRHAATRGVQEHDALQTIVEWAGPTPVGWRHVRLRRVGRLKTGTTPQGEASATFTDDEDALGWVRPEDLGRWTRPTRRLSEDAQSEVTVIPGDTALVCGIGSTVAKIGHVAEPCSTNQQITAVVAPGSDGRFMYYLLTAARAAILALTVGNTMPIINNDRLGSLWLALPPVIEQWAIADYLDEHTSKIEAVIETAQRFIELLRERRSALISAAVTGQIDVRGEVDLGNELAVAGEGAA